MRAMSRPLIACESLNSQTYAIDKRSLIDINPVGVVASKSRCSAQSDTLECAGADSWSASRSDAARPIARSALRAYTGVETSAVRRGAKASVARHKKTGYNNCC